MFLVTVKGINVGSIYSLNKIGPIIIGRGDICNIQILDLMISRKHCQIEKKSNSYYIRDLDSTNNTVLNNKNIDSEEKLSDGDIIEIGSTALIFTEQKEIPVKSVEDYYILRMSKTKSIQPPETK